MYDVLHLNTFLGIENKCIMSEKADQWFPGNGVGVERNRRWDYKGHQETFGGDDYVHSLDCGDGFIGQHYQNSHFKYVLFIACQLYLNKAVLSS